MRFCEMLRANMAVLRAEKGLKSGFWFKSSKKRVRFPQSKKPMFFLNDK